MKLRVLPALLLALTACVVLPALAQADGDPGSDVLLDQSLFYGSDTGISVKQELSLDRLLSATAKAGAPVRVAIIAHPDDLGVAAPLFNRPATYASYLGYELSRTYPGRLLIVMPKGFGVYWHANPAGATQLAAKLSTLKPAGGSAAALTAATVTAVDRIEASAGVDASKLAHPVPSVTPPASNGRLNAPTKSPPTANRHHSSPTGWFLAVLVLLTLLYVGWRRGTLAKLVSGARRARVRGGLRGVRIGPMALLPSVLLLIVLVALLLNHNSGSNNSPPTSQKVALATNPHLDPGTPLNRPAPNFTLTNQTGRQISLGQYRGKAVILAFVDAECQTICPLTTQAMLDAKAALGKAGKQVQLLGVNANWKSTQIDDVLNYSRLHGMLGRWQFLTAPGGAGPLEQVWKHYGVNEKALATKADNEIDHVAAIYLIDPQGRLRRVYTTYPSYTSIPQLGQLLAQDVAQLLPGHPTVRTHYTYAEAPQTAPTTATTLPKLGGGSVSLGPGRPHLYLFFDTWDEQTTQIAADLSELNTYNGAGGLPRVTAIDEGSVEPSPQALPRFIATLPHLNYPVAIDQTGEVADGYGVEGEPWFVLTNASGKIVWDWEVYTEGWPSTLQRLEKDVRDSLKTTSAPVGSSKSLAGSPAPLAKLHSQGSTLLGGGDSALQSRIKALHGYPIVLNIWGSWCTACRAESGLFAKASTLYGKRVAFLGADYGDNSADAEVFLRQHRVSYPSYGVDIAGVDRILVGGLQGTPTTVFLSPNGTVRAVHLNNYKSLAELEADIQANALDG